MTLRIGTCSWKFDSWQGLIYSEKGKQNYLEEYTRQYNTVEIDQWFWSLFGSGVPKLPEPQVVENYLESVPADFTFSIKMPNSITLTHYYQKDKRAPLQENPHFFSCELFHRFLERIEPLKEHLGPLMFQFEYLNKKKMPSQGEFLHKFTDFISKYPGGYDYAVETRNPNYLNWDFFDFLNTHNLHYVFVQKYYIPHIADVYKTYSANIKDLTVIRLMGPDRKGIEQKSGKKWDAVVQAKDEDLSTIVILVKELEEKGVRVYLNVNNHYEGSAPLTIRKIREMLEVFGEPTPF
ncbi:DUF72 domain-containing protein [Acidobacteriota bacterium]